MVLAEDQDRITRDLEDSAAIYKRLSFHDVELFTLAGGRVDELKIGFRGGMDALELRKLGEKVRRGQRGNLCPAAGCRAGSATATTSSASSERGQVDAGRRRINPEQAAIVRPDHRGICRRPQPAAIAHDLNGEGIRSPRGGEWRASAIIGNRRARSASCTTRSTSAASSTAGSPAGAIRTRATACGARPRPSDREIYELPELRIVSDDLWQAGGEAIERAGQQPLVRRRRPQRLLSGLVKCGQCGGAFTVFANDRCAARGPRGRDLREQGGDRDRPSSSAASSPVCRASCCRPRPCR
jgi:site-specific DNA recombinase